MKIFKNKRAFILGTAALVISLTAAAQQWPQQPIKIIVPFPAGGAGDIVPRIIGEKLSSKLKQPVIVENKPGAEGMLGMGQVARAKPDGYTLGVASSGPVVIGKHLFSNISYDPKKDLTPVALTYETPFVLAVPANSSAHSVAQLFKHSKENPGKFNISVPNNGSVQHLLTEQMLHAAGLTVALIPYKGGGPAVVALAAAEVQMTWAALPNILGLISANKARALAVSGKQRDPMLPDTPTIAESGWPMLTAANWNGLVAPTGTPESILNLLNQEINLILQDPQVIEKFKSIGISATPQSRDDFKNLMEKEEKKWVNVIQTAKISPI